MTVDAAANVVGYDDYYPYGMVMRSSTSSSVDARYKFTMKERDAETLYDYFGARYYDSRIGRWLSVDPKAHMYPHYSPYNYCFNNPLTTIDPDGRDTLRFNANGSYTGQYSKGGKNIGHIFDEYGNITRSFVFLDPSDVTSLESTRNADGSFTDPGDWETNGDGFVISGLNLDVENHVGSIILNGIGNIGIMPMVTQLSAIAYSSRYGAMDFANYRNPFGKMIYSARVGGHDISELSVIGNMAYNRFDAGNYFWGAAMNQLGFSPEGAQQAARMNERIFNHREDQIYDQIAIWNGATRIK